MRKFLGVFIISLVFSCERDNIDSTILMNQTYSGIRTIHYKLIDRIVTDKVTVNFEETHYQYSGTGYMDYGHGSYSVNGNSITFLDFIARDALHTWEWILAGTYELKSKGETLYFIHYNEAVDITFSLTRK